MSAKAITVIQAKRHEQAGRLLTPTRPPVRLAANAPTFEPPALSDPAFVAWAVRVALRLANKPPGAPDSAIESAICVEGQPNQEWAQGMAFMMCLAQSNKREDVARFTRGK